MPTIVGTAAQGGSVNQSSPLNITHNSGTTGERRCLVVGLALFDGAGSLSGITYGGNALTMVPGATVGTSISATGVARLYYLLNPPTGSNTLAITLNQAFDECYAIVQTWSDVNQATPFGTAVTQSNSSNTCNLPAMTLGASDISVGFWYGFSGSGTSPTQSDNLILETNGTTLASGRSMQWGDANLGWTLTNTPDNLAVGAPLIHDGGGGGVATGRGRLVGGKLVGGNLLVRSL